LAFLAKRDPVSRFTSLVILSAGAIALAACHDSPTPVTAPAGPAPTLDAAPESNEGRPPIRHLMLPKAQAAAAHASKQSTGIFYHGGPVMTGGTKVAAVYWASGPIYANGPTPGTSGATCADGSLIGIFLRGLGGSPYYNINSTYTDGAGNHVANAVSYTQCWANNTSVPANGQIVSDADMMAMLSAGFNSGALAFNAQTLYAIFTAGTVNLGGGFGTQYCAYHGYGYVTINGQSTKVLYAAMPYDYAYPSACTPSAASPNADAGANAEVNTFGHEIEETATDMYLNAWYDRSGQENADKCAWTFGTTYRTANGGVANMNIGGYDFLVQRNWVNAGSGGCLVRYP
jgi:hypothetical protein